jgi:CheY-like chemotaxis protein
MVAKLLVVDDDQGVRLVVEDTLVNACYRVLQAEDGARTEQSWIWWEINADEHPNALVRCIRS